MRVTMSSLSKSISSSSKDDAVELRRGPWTLEEDSLLIQFIARHGDGRWNLLAKRAGLRRTGKSCRLRWLNYLKPDVKRGNLTPEEQLLILDLHSKWGNRWSKIAQHLPGRTDNEIKNYWRTRVQKQARHLKIDANSTAFQDIIRCFWMPRLIQKIRGSNSSWPMSSQTTTISHQSLNYYNYAPHDHEHSTTLTVPPPPPPTQQQQKAHEQNSDSENCSSSCISSSAESLGISQISQLSEYPSSPFHVIGNNNATADHYSTFAKDCYYVDSNCYDMEPINPATMSVPGGFGNPASDRHVVESDWTGCDFGDTMWNMDELWQFRNLQDGQN